MPQFSANRPCPKSSSTDTSNATDLSVVLHIGAHKTASTHLQQSLRHAVPALAKAGVRYYGPESLRQEGQTLPERFGFPLDPNNIRHAADPKAQLAKMRGDADRIIFSEENFAGNFQRGWGKVPVPLYPSVHARITRFADALGQSVHLCVALRQPSDFLASLYSQILLSGKTVSPDEFLERNSPAEIDWVAYINQLQQSDGVCHLTVWRYEDYGNIFAQICHAMAGKAGALVEPLSERAMPRLSKAAVGAALAQRLLGVNKTPIRSLAESYPSGPGNPPFELFDRETRDAAAVDYAAQVTAIDAMPKVTVLWPQATA